MMPVFMAVQEWCWINNAKNSLMERMDEEGIKKVLKGEKWEKNARINGNGIKIQTVDEKAHLSN